MEPTEKEVVETIAKGLKAMREEKGLTQLKVLNDTGIHIARIEIQERTITVHTLKRICHYYKISMSKFLNKYCSGL